MHDDDIYRCPAGERLTYRYTNEEDGKRLRRYWTTACTACPLKPKCTTGSAYIDRLQRKKVELARQAFAKELQAIDKRLEGKRHKGESEKQCFTRSMCMSREELWEMFKINPKEAFGYLGGDEYDEADLYKRAGKILGAQDAKLEAKVRARTEPYKYANTAVSVDFGGVKQGDQDDEPVSTVDGDVADVKDAA